MEILDLYDDEGKKLRETIIRGNKPEKGKNIMLSVVFIKTEDGKYLIQKTSESKGSKYATTGGHVIHGENPTTTIIRELKEELNIKTTKKEIKFLDSFKYPTKNCIFNIFILDFDKKRKSEIKLQDIEVASVQFLTEKQIQKLIKEGKFLESHAYIYKTYIKK